MLTILFWTLIGIIVYAYFGYTALLLLISLFRKKNELTTYKAKADLPTITHVIAAYNELEIIPEKIANCTSLNYPQDKILHLWVTDGSNDGSNNYLTQNTSHIVLHKNERKGKTAALNRAMKQVSTSITIFSDANTILSENALLELAAGFNAPNTGCVAGEKQVISNKKDSAPGAGEGLYWNYESVIKSLESTCNSTMGAVGELYAIRTELFQELSENTILDDFLISMSCLEKGYKIKYCPRAMAREKSSYSINDEVKRKIRIAAGGFQVLFGKPSLLNIFKRPFSSFQFLSHKVLRWVAVPFCFPLLLIINILLVKDISNSALYTFLLALQILFYAFALLGYAARNYSTRVKILFIPYYVFIMNVSQISGLFRYLSGNQSAAWEKAKRNH